MAKIIDGKSLAQKLNNQLKIEIFKLSRSSPPPTLAVVLVGKDPASEVYVKHKAIGSKSVGINSQIHHLPSNVSERELLSLIESLNRSKIVNGILVQLPLPKKINPKNIIESIYPEKDVDGFHPINVGKLYSKDVETGLIPCTPLGVIALLKSTKVKLKSKHAVVVGRSHIVGRPVAELLLQADATVTICHRFTKNLQSCVNEGDIVVSAVGKPHLIKGAWFKKGAIAIDVGISRLGKKMMVGDIDFESAKKRCSYLTPVPGGVGPMTIAMLLSNTVKAYKMQRAE